MRWLMLIIAALAIVLTLIWQSDRERPSPEDETVERPSEPDYWMESAYIERFDAHGTRIMDLSARHMAHFPDDKRSELKTIQAQQRGPDEVHWTLESKQGHISGDRSRIWLEGQVKIVRQAGSGPETRIDTDELTLFPDIDEAETEAAVRMQRLNTVTTGTGLVAKMAEDQVRILKDVRTHHAAKQD